MDVSKVVGVDVGRRKKVRVGRGSGSGLGKTSGRGSKGASSRTGFGGLLHREGGQMPLIRRLPKRGFKNSLFRVSYEVVNVEQLVAFAGAPVTPELLKERGIVKKRAERVKVLGGGDVGVKLDVHAHAFSASARRKIEAAGGTATVVGATAGKGEADRG
jgi:large subunit ribosomal protein L15